MGNVGVQPPVAESGMSLAELMRSFLVVRMCPARDSYPKRFRFAHPSHSVADEVAAEPAFAGVLAGGGDPRLAPVLAPEEYAKLPLLLAVRELRYAIDRPPLVRALICFADTPKKRALSMPCGIRSAPSSIWSGKRT